MTFTDIFIRRPVLATVLSLLLIVVGYRAYQNLPLRQYPKLENPVIAVTTTYPGADADLVNGFITTPIQQAIASAEGIDYIKATSNNGVSVVEAHIKLDYSANDALTEILAKVNKVKNRLPSNIQDPVVAKQDARGSAIMYISFYSDSMSNTQISDYLVRAVQPQLTTLEGVADAQVIGNQTFAMRIWLDAAKMSGFGITAADVNSALKDNNFQSAAGEITGPYVVTGVKAATGLHTAKGFGALVVKSNGKSLIRLRDIARVELDAESYRMYVSFNGKGAIYVGVNATPTANPLEVIKRVRAAMPSIQKQLPAGLKGSIVYDATRFISASISEVVKTLIEAMLIVVLVIFLFLGSFRSVIIPLVTIPLSLVGVLFLMAMLGYSINLLTLLAMVMAISLVVDDAIVVVENVHRHIEEGLSPFAAALKGAREIASPVISMTITLAAVYAPIGFMGGITGKLFTEFAFTLAGAVLISGFIALTLSPMMASKLLRADSDEGGFAGKLDAVFARVKTRYQRLLGTVLHARGPVLAVVSVILLSIGVMVMMTRSELAPNEDQGIIFIIGSGPQSVNIEYTKKFSAQYYQMMKDYPEFEGNFLIAGMGGQNKVISGMILKPWGERQRNQLSIQPELQRKFKQITGLDTFAVNPPSLPGSSIGLPVQFILSTTADFRVLDQVSQDLVQKARASGKFLVVNNTLKINKPQIELSINREKAAQLGIKMRDVGVLLATMLGDFRTNYFDMAGRSYQVIPQVNAKLRDRLSRIGDYYIKTARDGQVPLSTIMRVKETVQPNALTQFQQLNAATIQALPVPGTSLGDALATMRKLAAEVMPDGFKVDYEGQSRQYQQEGAALGATFVFAMVIIFLVLAAQFESFRDPLVVLVSVPLSIFGAMIPLFFGMATLNIYTEVGLVTLIGLISKHGILIVEFANQLMREKGLDRVTAVSEAAAIRLRPILMTTGAMVLGVLPLVLAQGAGAVSRFDIGLVISVGMSVGTLFTLFVVPTMYTLLAKQHDPGERG